MLTTLKIDSPTKFLVRFTVLIPDTDRIFFPFLNNIAIVCNILFQYIKME